VGRDVLQAAVLLMLLGEFVEVGGQGSLVTNRPFCGS
jgi:hypothetical protein